jgi:hypothetical protein
MKTFEFFQKCVEKMVGDEAQIFDKLESKF